MSDVDYHGVITGEARVLAEAARAGELDARVPSCPEWDVADLVRHLGTAHRWSRRVVDTGEPVAPKSVDRGLPDDPRGLPDWLEAGAAALVATLAATDPDADCWTWAGDQHARFWSRRMAFETAVHRWDGEGALGAPSAFAGPVAVDGIDEHLANLPYFREPARGGGETLHLHCTDRDGEWLLRLEPDALAVTREHAKGDVALRGAASDLFLVVLGRRPPSTVEVFGPADALATWAPVLRF
jgi:uncharacterized protein (TIGR03083 family)